MAVTIIATLVSSSVTYFAGAIIGAIAGYIVAGALRKNEKSSSDISAVAQGILANKGWDEMADIATGKYTTSTGWKGSEYDNYARAPGTVWHEALHGKLEMTNEERAIRELLARAGIEQDVDVMHELGYHPEQMAPVDTSEVYSQLPINPVLTGIETLPNWTTN